jgi:hypothetical protein
MQGHSAVAIRPTRSAGTRLGSAAWRSGNTGIEGVWHFDSGEPGRKLLVTALERGDEHCGALALREALQGQLRPWRGTLTVVFAEPSAHDRSEERGAQMLPFVEEADWLLGLQSAPQQQATPALLTGLQKRNIELALELGGPYTVVIDTAMQGRLHGLDLGRFSDPQNDRTRSLVIQCGFRAAPNSRHAALELMARFLVASGCMRGIDIPQHWWKRGSSKDHSIT